MVTKTKHIPATPDLLRIGQVVEVYQHNKKWNKYHILDLVTCCQIFEWYAEDEFEIRIPLITHEDILSCGWKHEDTIHGVDIYRLKEWELQFFCDAIGIRKVSDWEQAIDVYAQTLLDLKGLMIANDGAKRLF